MTSDKLDNLVRIGQLKKEPPNAAELAGLKRSGLARMGDAERLELSFESRFDLAYNAAHALALYALRRTGYRPVHRYLVFQTLPDTAGLSAGHWRVLAKAHEKRAKRPRCSKPQQTNPPPLMHQLRDLAALRQWLRRLPSIEDQ